MGKPILKCLTVPVPVRVTWRRDGPNGPITVCDVFAAGSADTLTPVELRAYVEEYVREYIREGLAGNPKCPLDK